MAFMDYLFGGNDPQKGAYQNRGALSKILLAMGGAPTVQNIKNQDATQDVMAGINNGSIDKASALARYGEISGDPRSIIQDGTTPAAIQEYTYFNGLDPEGQKRYLSIKRANQMFDLGGSQRVIDPQGDTVLEVNKTLPPEQLPTTKKEQAAATAVGTAEGNAEASRTNKIASGKNTLPIVEEARKELQNASGGVLDTVGAMGKRVVGVSDAETQANQRLKLISGKLTLDVPRMEGPQSNADAKLYAQTAANVGDSTIPVGDRLAALDTLEALQKKYADLQPEGKTSAERNNIPGGIPVINFDDLP